MYNGEVLCKFETEDPKKHGLKEVLCKIIRGFPKKRNMKEVLYKIKIGST